MFLPASIVINPVLGAEAWSGAWLGAIAGIVILGVVLPVMWVLLYRSWRAELRAGRTDSGFFSWMRARSYRNGLGFWVRQGDQ